MFGKKQIFDSNEVKKMVKDITKGSLGTVIRKGSYQTSDIRFVDEVYSYQNGKLSIMYSEEGLFSNESYNYRELYYIYYDNMLAYRTNNLDESYVNKRINSNYWLGDLFCEFQKHLQALHELEPQIEKPVQRIKKSH